MFFELIVTSWIQLYVLQNTDDLGAFGQRMGINAPILAVCPASEECTFYIIVEQEPTCELNRFNSALILPLISYTTFQAFQSPFTHAMF